MLLSLAAQTSHGDGNPLVANLISESGAALHVDALRSIEVIHTEGSVVAAGLSGTGTKVERNGRHAGGIALFDAASWGLSLIHI